MEPYGVVYLIQNMANGKRYVGKTIKTLKQRMSGHLCGNLCVDKAIEKYGIDNFRYGVIKTYATEAELNEGERHFIAILYSKAPYGYNLTDGGDGTSGLKQTPEHREKIAAANTGKKRTLEQRAKISSALTGKKRTPEQRAKIAAAKKGKKRKPHSPEHCAKLAAANIGKKLTSEQCAKIATTKRKSPFKNLLAELDARQMSYTDLARFLKLSTPSISKKMRGKANFTKRDKAKLVEIFGKPIEYLLERDEATICEESSAPCRKCPFKNLLCELDEHQLTYAALAKLMGISYANIARKMRGERGFTERDKAKLPEIFGKPIEYLLERFD